MIQSRSLARKLEFNNWGTLAGKQHQSQAHNKESNLPRHSPPNSTFLHYLQQIWLCVIVYCDCIVSQPSANRDRWGWAVNRLKKSDRSSLYTRVSLYGLLQALMLSWAPRGCSCCLPRRPLRPFAATLHHELWLDRLLISVVKQTAKQR